MQTLAEGGRYCSRPSSRPSKGASVKLDALKIWEIRGRLGSEVAESKLRGSFDLLKYYSNSANSIVLVKENREFIKLNTSWLTLFTIVNSDRKYMFIR